jgi:hypothetical protein
LKFKIIERCRPGSRASQFGSPIVMVRKKDGTYRMCVDYRAVNRLTKTERYNIPNMEELISTVSSSKYLTTLDYARGYNQILMSDESVHYTTFVCPFGQFIYLKMPFGLVSACITCQKLSDLV